MSNLRSRLIRLAHQKPELRPHLLPLLTKRAAVVYDAAAGVELAEAVRREMAKVLNVSPARISLSTNSDDVTSVTGQFDGQRWAIFIDPVSITKIHFVIAVGRSPVGSGNVAPGAVQRYAPQIAAKALKYLMKDRSFMFDRQASDHSTNPTVVEYAVQELFKGKGPAAAAKATAKKLSGGTNLFIGGGSEEVAIDPKELENALWDRLADRVIDGIKKTKPGADLAGNLLGVAMQFKQIPLWKPGFKPYEAKFVVELKKRVIKKLGRNPFET